MMPLMHTSILPARATNPENFVFVCFFMAEVPNLELPRDLGHRVDDKISNRKHYSKVWLLPCGPVLGRFSFLSFPTCLSVCILATRPKCCLNYSVNRRRNDFTKFVWMMYSINNFSAGFGAPGFPWGQPGSQGGIPEASRNNLFMLWCRVDVFCTSMLVDVMN